MKYTVLLILFTLVSCSVSFAQYTNVMISNSTSPEEVSICINPKNTNLIIAGSNTNPTTTSGAYYYSSNAGLNWTGAIMVCTLYGVWGDPIVMIDTAGALYYFHLANNPNLPWPAIDRMVCQKSTNGGVNWSAGTYAGYNPPTLEDKEGICIDPANNYIYISWTQFDVYGTTNPADSSRIMFSKSTDGGATWYNSGGPGIRLDRLGGDCYDADNTVEGAVPAVGPNGEVYVAWTGPKVRNSQFGIFFQKSTDHGVTWLANPIYVADQPGGWDYGINGIYRANGLPATCCDLSNGPYRGNIYINYTDSAGPNDHDVRLIKSTNGGVNWSSVKRVNNDPAGKEQFFSWMTVDQSNGYLYFVFYDRRNYNNTSTDVYMARSTDGGETFTNFVVSSSPFTPTPYTFFGDYTSVSACSGHVRPMWMRLDGSTLSVWTAIVDMLGTDVNDPGKNLPSEYSLSQNFPNPFNPTTEIKYQLKENTFVTLKVFDVLGKEVASLVNEYKPAGSYSFAFYSAEYNLSSGVYFYKLTAGDFSDVKRMVLTK